MKARSTIITFAVVSFFLVFSDAVQHFGRVAEAHIAMTSIKPDDRLFESVRDTMIGERWSVARDAMVLVAQIIVMCLMAREQPNKKRNVDNPERSGGLSAFPG